MECNVIKVSQPIGDFYLTSLPATTLLKVATVKQRGRDEGGVQRKESEDRAKEIALYLTDPDATFPTPFIIACYDNMISVDGHVLFFDDTQIIGEIIDGQHRFLGMQLAKPEKIESFEVPVVIMTGLDTFDKAYVFSSINSKQRPVPKSLIYDLFDLSELKSPYKTCHEIAKALNSDEKSPFYNGLKMLGKRTSDMEYLTQGSFVTTLLKRISANPQADEIAIKNKASLEDDEKYPFRYYWIQEQDHLILKVLENYFGAIKEVFEKEWNHPTASNYILRKTVGFVALMDAFDVIWSQARKTGRADKEFFLFFARKFRENLKEKKLTAEEFRSSGASATALKTMLLGETGTLVFPE